MVFRLFKRWYISENVFFLVLLDFGIYENGFKLLAVNLFEDMLDIFSFLPIFSTVLYVGNSPNLH